MNYAFFGHARWFYGSPLIVAIAVVGMDYLVVCGVRSRWRLAGCACLPAIAVALATRPFHEDVPVQLLPLWLRDPMVANLAIAAIAWWFGYVRHGRPAMLHAGSAALAWALYRVVGLNATHSPALAHSLTAVSASSQELAALALYAVTGYLLLVALLRRSRTDGLACLGVHQAAITVLVWERVYGDVMIICFVAGWSWLIGLHLTTRRPRALAALWPIAFMVVVTWLNDFDEWLQLFARMHAAGIVIVLLFVGQMWRWTGYRLIAVGVGAGDLLFYTGRWITAGPYPAASFVVISGFLLLITGAVISWYKPKLLDTRCLAGRVEPLGPSG